MDTIVTAGQHLDLTSIFAIVLIYIKVDVSIESEGLTHDHILSYIFPDERTLTFNEKLNVVFGPFQESLLITKIAIPFLLNILREPLFFNNVISAIFILSKDLLPHSKNSSNEHLLSFNDLIRYEIQRNSIIGKFLHSAYLVYTADPFIQENYNFDYLQSFGSFNEHHILDCLFEFEQRSMIAKILFSGDNLKTFDQFKSEHFENESIQAVYLKDLLQSTDDKLRPCSEAHRSLDKKAIPRFHIKQDTKDYFFSGLDCCCNQFEVLDLLHTLNCHSGYNRETKFLLEVLTTIIESGEFEEDRDLTNSTYMYILILLSFEPGLRDSGLVSKSISDRITEFTESIETLINKASCDLPVVCASFVLAESRLDAYEGNFQKAYNAIFMAIKVMLQRKSLRRGPRILEYESISFTQTKKDLFLSMGYGYGQETYDNPIFKINQYRSRCDENAFIHSGITVEDFETLASFGEKNTEQTLNYRKYNHAKMLAVQKMFIDAMHEIDVALEGTNSRNFMWIFEFKLLKCLFFEKSCDNAAKVMRVYHETFIDNETYMNSLDLYRKLLVGAYYMLFTQKNKVFGNNTYRFYCQNDAKVKFFKNTRLINVWEDIYANL